MLYHLLAPLGKSHIIFNLFNYISFRAAGAMVTALLLAFIVGPAIIRRLRARKVGQVVRAEGPASHQGKRGTPDDGRAHHPALRRSSRRCSGRRSPTGSSSWRCSSMLWMGSIGFLDDYLKIVQGKSRGLVAKWKLVGQVCFGVVLGLFLVYYPGRARPSTIPATATTLPFFKYRGGQLRALALRGLRDVRRSPGAATR